MPPELASWVQAQRSKFRSGILEEERAELLLALGVNFSDTKFTQKWMSAYTLYIEYKNLYNQEPRQKVRYKGRDLGTWIWN